MTYSAGDSVAPGFEAVSAKLWFDPQETPALWLPARKAGEGRSGESGEGFPLNES